MASHFVWTNRSKESLTLDVKHAEARRVLESDDFAAEVEADSAELRALGGNGVPFFVIDRRFGISGAQPTEVFERALAMAHEAATQESSSSR